MDTEDTNKDKEYLHVIAKLINVILILIMVIILLACLHFCGKAPTKPEAAPEQSAAAAPAVKAEVPSPAAWSAPDSSEIAKEKQAALISYGRDLVKNTAYYFGPQGKIFQQTNGMNCQNCHLDAGTKPYGNNYGAVASTYPKFRERSGTIETVARRVNDCFERSLNGKALDTSGKEMRAILAYILWLGKEVPKKERPVGAGITDLAYLERAADPVHGKVIYDLKCKSCHAEQGEGKLAANRESYQYPPLWGNHSYNTGAGLYRLSRFASYVKYNMPQGATFENPQLTDEEAWDVAAYVNSQPRPVKDLRKDWPNISGKPVDHPFGPYADSFSEKQHKYGPFGPILEASVKK